MTDRTVEDKNMALLKSEKQRLEQRVNLAQIFKPTKPSEMVTVYCDIKDLDENNNTQHWHNHYAILIPTTYTSTALNSCHFDVIFESVGIPKIIKSYRNGEVTSIYNRYGTNNGIEPLVICRDFDDIKPSYNEVSEEFRLFHNLYHDSHTNEYLKASRDGNLEKIIVITEDKIDIRLKEIRQFLAAKDMYLSVQFNYTEYSQYKLGDLNLSETPQIEKDEIKHWELRFGNSIPFGGNDKSLSDLRGKYLIAPYKKKDSDVWGLAGEKEEKYEDFIIGEDDEGNPILKSSKVIGIDPKDYLKKVCFEKKVLDKYYKESSKYKISSGSLSCIKLWRIDIDNGHDDIVFAWLGDLGEKLPHREQLHWKSHNIISQRGISKAFANNQIWVIPTNSIQPDDCFKREFEELNKEFKKRLGWDLFLPLQDGDKHCLQSIRIPSTNEPIEFDELILHLSKLLSDSLNVKKLKELVNGDNSNSIDLLKELLSQRNINNYESHIKFLRNLQSLRSTGAAHRKGSRYAEVSKSMDIGKKPLPEIYKDLLISARGCIKFLHENMYIFYN